jgi:two-component system NtrC family sensor kinase
MKNSESSNSVTSALKERVKELSCLYSISQICAQPGISTEEILQAIVELIPSAWQFSEIASARLTLDNVTYKTSNFRKDSKKQTADIIISGKCRGIIEIVYVKEIPEFKRGVFLKEERNLINAIAKQVALIIERREAEKDKSMLHEQLLHADRLATIGMLAAGVAHELSEPLGNILGFAQLIRNNSDITNSIKQDIEKIENASLQSREIIQKLLIFARQVPSEKKKVNLNQIVRDGLFFFESRCAKAGIELIKLLDPELPDIVANSSQMNQVLVNLIVNAQQSISGQGKIIVQTKYDTRHVILIVKDTGCGMDKQVLDKIFIPFFTTKDVGHGTGLGLPVVHGIITGHGGSINVRSEIGLGTSFEIKIPIKNQHKAKEKY